MFTHPILTFSTMATLYKTAYTGQASLHNTHGRVLAQASFIRDSMPFPLTNQTIVELGCAGGHLLFQFLEDDNRLICVEADPDLHARAKRTLDKAVSFQLVPSVFDNTTFPPNSVDFMMSSHVVEHMPDPCSFARAALKALKPGGVMFHEIPHQSRAHLKRRQEGQYHLTFLSKDSLRQSMESCGFETLALETFRIGNLYNVRTTQADKDRHWIRGLWRKPRTVTTEHQKLVELKQLEHVSKHVHGTYILI